MTTSCVEAGSPRGRRLHRLSVKAFPNQTHESLLVSTQAVFIMDAPCYIYKAGGNGGMTVFIAEPVMCTVRVFTSQILKEEVVPWLPCMASGLFLLWLLCMSLFI